jgi:multidrug efflux pump
VDDAIVMIENIVRYMEKGGSPLQAAYEGAKEIGFTIISLTVSLIAVFIPLLFMSGIVGRLFREFALTLTIAVVVSAVVSLTLTPMMAARLLRAPAHESKRSLLARIADAPLQWMQSFYRVTLDAALRVQGLVLLIALATVAITVYLYIAIPKGFLPEQDTGFISAESLAATDVSFERMQTLQNKVEETIRRDPDVVGVVSIIGAGATTPTPNSGHFAITVKPKANRMTFATEIVERLNRATRDIAGIATQFQAVPDIQIGTRSSRTQYQYVLVGTDPAIFSEWAGKMLDALKAEPSLRDVASDLQEQGPTVMINVDRVAAGRLGVSMQDVNNALYNAFGQRQISTIYAQSNQYRVILEAMPQYQSDPNSLSRLYVPGTGGVQVPLSAFARFVNTTAPLMIAHYEQFPAVTISFNLAPHASLSDAVATVEAAERDLGMPTSVIGSYSGDAAEFARSLAGQPWLILAAIIAIYIVLGVLYESVIHPITILSTLPSAGLGALLALIVLGYDLSVIALIGIVLLMGIVKKNAIMMIDFALEAERVQGMTPRDSIVQAALLRFRPIMMTTLAALFGAIPLAVESGTGSELRNPLGITIIGGLLLSQLLTLYTTPVIYLQMERLRARWSRKPGSTDEPELDLPAAPEPSQRPAE